MGSNPEVSAPPARTTRHRLSTEDRESIALLRKLFQDAKYTEPDIRRAIHAELATSIPTSDTALVDRILPREGLLPALIRLFLCDLPADPVALAGVIQPLTVEKLQALGLVHVGPGGVKALVRFLPVDDMALACDLFAGDESALPVDFVLGVNPTSVELSTVTSRRPVKTTLDLGTGCGIQSVLAARHSGRIVATDLNARALNFTAFNCLLNGITNVECREGSLFEPVAGETFDLVVSNPPYVISPDSDFQYRDSGQPLDTFCRTLVKQLPAYLNEGGYAAILCNWAIRGTEHWSAPVREWVAGSNCDALLLHTYSQSPQGYAGTWNRALSTTQPKAFGEALDRWTGHFQRSGIVSIASGIIILRKRAGGPHWVDISEIPVKRDHDCGSHIVRMIEARDWLWNAGSAETILQTAFRPADDFRLEQILGFKDGRLTPLGIWGGLAGGFRFRGEIDPATARLVSLADGRRTLAEIVDALRQEFEVSLEEIRGKVLTIVKELFSAGFLVRA